MQMPKDVTVMGDPHLGRQFKTGVPLHRVGEREEMQWQQFEQELVACSTNYHINMGDLFDKFIVSPEIVLRAVEAYRQALDSNNYTVFIILRGNHDTSRDSSKASSFDLFKALFYGEDRVVVVNDEAVVRENYGFVPFHPFTPTDDLVAELPDGLKAIFGHWDIQDWGGDNVIPTRLLKKKKIKLAISGHDHLGREEKRDGVDIIVTGSMQPYTHAEDAEGSFYRTVTLDQLEEINAKDLNIRVLLKPGETLPTDLDCLSMTAKQEVADKLEVDTSDFEALDLGQMLAQALDGLSIKEQLMEQFHQ